MNDVIVQHGWPLRESEIARPDNIYKRLRGKLINRTGAISACRHCWCKYWVRCGEAMAMRQRLWCRGWPEGDRRLCLPAAARRVRRPTVSRPLLHVPVVPPGASCRRHNKSLPAPHPRTHPILRGLGPNGILLPRTHLTKSLILRRAPEAIIQKI